MCVQERADDRPTMSTVVAMLNRVNFILPEPKHPAYFNLRVSKEDESGSVLDSHNDVTIWSNDDVAVTEEPDGR